jgi:hypothetical protein
MSISYSGLRALAPSVMTFDSRNSLLLVLLDAMLCSNLPLSLAGGSSVKVRGAVRWHLHGIEFFNRHLEVL